MGWVDINRVQQYTIVAVCRKGRTIENTSESYNSRLLLNVVQLLYFSQALSSKPLVGHTQICPLAKSVHQLQQLYSLTGVHDQMYYQCLWSQLDEQFSVEYKQTILSSVPYQLCFKIIMQLLNKQRICNLIYHTPTTEMERCEYILYNVYIFAECIFHIKTCTLSSIPVRCTSVYIT